jgi:hypothetical protein
MLERGWKETLKAGELQGAPEHNAFDVSAAGKSLVKKTRAKPKPKPKPKKARLSAEELAQLQRYLSMSCQPI